MSGPLRVIWIRRVQKVSLDGFGNQILDLQRSGSITHHSDEKNIGFGWSKASIGMDLKLDRIRSKIYWFRWNDYFGSQISSLEIRDFVLRWFFESLLATPGWLISSRGGLVFRFGLSDGRYDGGDWSIGVYGSDLWEIWTSFGFMVISCVNFLRPDEVLSRAVEIFPFNLSIWCQVKEISKVLEIPQVQSRRMSWSLREPSSRWFHGGFPTLLVSLALDLGRTGYISLIFGRNHFGCFGFNGLIGLDRWIFRFCFSFFGVLKENYCRIVVDLRDWRRSHWFKQNRASRESWEDLRFQKTSPLLGEITDPFLTILVVLGKGCFCTFEDFLWITDRGKLSAFLFQHQSKSLQTTGLITRFDLSVSLKCFRPISWLRFIEDKDVHGITKGVNKGTTQTMEQAIFIIWAELHLITGNKTKGYYFLCIGFSGKSLSRLYFIIRASGFVFMVFRLSFMVIRFSFVIKGILISIKAFILKWNILTKIVGIVVLKISFIWTDKDSYLFLFLGLKVLLRDRFGKRDTRKRLVHKGQKQLEFQDNLSSLRLEKIDLSGEQPLQSRDHI